MMLYAGLLEQEQQDRKTFEYSPGSELNLIFSFLNNEQRTKVEKQIN
jgi:hypothetical protein